MKSFGWALIGPGRIARRFADAVQRLDHARLVTVHGRDAARAAAFAQTWTRDGRPPVRVAAGIEALLADPDVDGVYIATPHAFHAASIRTALVAGKPVLCEKPLVPNEAQAIELIALAQQHRVFLMEAVWTRFLPIYAVVREWLQSQAIGRVHTLQSAFCIDMPFDAAARTHDPAQAGGALLDIGIYNLTITRWVLAAATGACPPLQLLNARGVIGPSGVDHRVEATLEFPQGVVSQFVCSFDEVADNGFHIAGERGTIHIAGNFWEATGATLHRIGESALTVRRPHRINGFEGEIEEAMRVIAAGGIESAGITHAETRETLRWMDRIRADIGVRYPFEDPL